MALKNRCTFVSASRPSDGAGYSIGYDKDGHKVVDQLENIFSTLEPQKLGRCVVIGIRRWTQNNLYGTVNI